MSWLSKLFKSLNLSGRSKGKAKPDYEASAEETPGETLEQLEAEKDCRKEKPYVVVKNNKVELVEPCSSTSSASEDAQNDNVVAETDVCDGPQKSPERSHKKLATDGGIGPSGTESSSEDYYSDSESDDDDELQQIPVVQMDSGPPIQGYVFCIFAEPVQPTEASDERDEDDGVVPVPVTENSSSHSPVTNEVKQNFQLEEQNDEGVQDGGQFLMDGEHIDQHEMSHSLAEYPQEDSGNLSAYLEENNMFDDDPVEGDVASLGDGSYEYSNSFYADYDHESS